MERLLCNPFARVRSWGISALILIGFLALRCSDLGSGPTAEIKEDHSPITDPLERWRAYRLSDYILEEQRQCFCIYGGEWCDVYVRGGQVADVVVIATGERMQKEYQRWYKTADQLFAFVHSINPDSVAQFRLEYDSRFGYPRDVWVDYDHFMADEEVGYRIRAVRRIVE